MNTYILELVIFTMASRFPKRPLSRKEIEKVANFSSDDESVDLHSNIFVCELS